MLVHKRIVIWKEVVHRNVLYRLKKTFQPGEKIGQNKIEVWKRVLRET